jgi:hypothetical protein
MAKQIKNMNNRIPTQDEISARAYQIFIERGSPEGRDLEHWLEAESQLSAQSNGSSQLQQQQKQIDPGISAKPQKNSMRQTAGRRA